MVALDLRKAFDTVSHSKLLHDIYDSSLANVYKRFMANYMAGRQYYVEFSGSRSGFRKNRQGVPQGNVLSPMLFNTYISKIPTPPSELKLISYADDCTVLTSGRDIEVLEARLNGYLPVLRNFLANLALSASKSTATIFTTWTREVRKIVEIKIAELVIPTILSLARTPEIG